MTNVECSTLSDVQRHQDGVNSVATRDMLYEATARWWSDAKMETAAHSLLLYSFVLLFYLLYPVYIIKYCATTVLYIDT